MSEKKSPTPPVSTVTKPKSDLVTVSGNLKNIPRAKPLEGKSKLVTVAGGIK